MRCERCGTESYGFIVSMFNTQTVCFPCKKAEEEHPLYQEARAAELAAVKNGDFNFPGIGLPPELEGGAKNVGE